MSDQWKPEYPPEGTPLTPHFVRDQMVRCFAAAQMDVLIKAGQRMGKSLSEEEIERKVSHLIRQAFLEAGERFEEPTRVSLLQVMEILKRKSRVVGKEQEIIEHHAAQMLQLIKALPAV